MFLSAVVQMSILPVIGGAAANPPPPNPYTYGDEYI